MTSCLLSAWCSLPKSILLFKERIFFTGANSFLYEINPTVKGANKKQMELLHPKEKPVQNGTFKMYHTICTTEHTYHLKGQKCKVELSNTINPDKVANLYLHCLNSILLNLYMI